MHKILFLCLLLFSSPLWGIELASEKAILINSNNGKILFEKNAYEKAFPASITKIATALFALEMMGEENLDQLFTASQNAIASISPQAKRQSNYRSPPHLLETDGCHMSIKKGEELTFYDLLCGMLIASANDAANVIAENVVGSIPEFMKRLNEYLYQLGCKNTHFYNPHGLFHPDHSTTAYDMALISRKAMQSSVFRQIVALPSYTVPQTNYEYERKIVQTNSLIRPGSHFYPKAIGIKTGYTSQAGKNIVAAAEDKKRSLIAVILSSPTVKERYTDAIHLFEMAFSEKKMRHYLYSKEKSVFKKKVPHGTKELVAFLPDGLYYDFYPSEKTTVKAKIIWAIPQLPIEKGTFVGKINLLDEKGFAIQTLPLFAQEKLTPTLFYRLIEKLKEKRRAVFWITSGFFLFLLISFLRRPQKKVW